MRIFKYLISNGEYTRLCVDEEMAKYIEELCSIKGTLKSRAVNSVSDINYYRYFSKYYNPKECFYEITCNRELTKKVMEVCTSCCTANPIRSILTSNRELDEYKMMLYKEEYKMPVNYNYNPRRIPTPVKIINQGPATIVFWNDKTKTVVKCSAHDEFDIDMAITMACLKKMVGDEAYAAAKQMGHKKRLNDIIEWKY